MHVTTERLDRLQRSLELALNREWPQLSATQKRLARLRPTPIPIRPANAKSLTVVATVATDRGENKLSLEPIRSQVIRGGFAFKRRPMTSPRPLLKADPRFACRRHIAWHTASMFLMTRLVPGLLLLAGVTPAQVVPNPRHFQLQGSGFVQGQIVRCGVAGMADGGNIELKKTLGDIKSQSHFGLYCAIRFAGGELARFRKNKHNEHKDNAVAYLQGALEEWKKNATQLDESYVKVRIPVHGTFDWDTLTAEVEYDNSIARDAK